MTGATWDDSGVLRCGEGSLETVKDIHVVHLRGTYAEMGRQHAALASEVCGDIVIRYMGGLIEKLVAHVVPPLAKPADAALKAWFLARNRGRLGPEIRAHLEALAGALGMKKREALATFMMPDILHYLAGRSMAPLAFPPMCSAFWAAGSATRGGRQVLGRNFDFFGRGVWNECNALIVMHPPEGRSFCLIGSLGVSGSGQGFNESGLFLGLHTKFCGDVATGGLPLFSLCHDILARCATLDEAMALFRDDDRMCGLTIFLADTRARRAACVEFSARHHRVVDPVDGLLLHTNHYLADEMKRHEVAPHPWQRNSHARLRRMRELLGARRGSLAPKHVPGILGDCRDPYEERMRVTGNIMAMVNTTQSVVLSPDEDTLWVAKGDHPVSRAERYAGFRMSALLAGDRRRYARPDLRGARQLPPAERRALGEYVQAWTEYFDKLDTDAAVFRLLRARSLLPGEAIFPRMAALLLMQQGKYDRALPLFEENARYEYRDGLMRCESLLWLGRCLDLMKRRGAALEQYGKARAMGVPLLSAAAARHLKRPFRRRHMIDVSPEFITGTALAKYRGA